MSCEVQMKLQWDGTQFVTTHLDGTYNEDAWARCVSTQVETPCEHSSGTCFVEERRTWGYVTLVRKGCKQAQACYMQKYQNFLVENGRQCWPESNDGMLRRISARPHDLKADEWIYDIIIGGSKSTSSSPAVNTVGVADFSDTAFSDATFANRLFDNTFTDMGISGTDQVADNDSNGFTEGLLIPFNMTSL